MKSIILTAAFVALALPAYAVHTTRSFSPPTVSTYTTDKAQEKQLKAHGG